jgi:hypothetical protein
MAQLSRAQQKLRKCQKNNKIKVCTDGDYKMFPEVKYLYEGDVNTFYIFSEKLVEAVCYNQHNDKDELLEMFPVHPTYFQSENDYIHKMCGIKYLNQLYAEDEVSTKTGSQIPHLQQAPKEKSSNKDRIIQVSQDLGILSKYTAFIGVKVVENKDGKHETAELKQIPLQRPQRQYDMFDLREGALESCMIQSCSSGFASSRSASSSRGPVVKSMNFFESAPISYKKKEGVMRSMSSAKSVKKSAKYSSSESEDGDEDILNDSRIRNCSKKCETVSSTGFLSSAYNFVSSLLPNSNNSTVDSTSTKSAPSLNTMVAKYVVKDKLPAYNVLGQCLTGKQNGELPFASEVQVDDYIKITMEDGNNGIYKVIKIGSKDSPWVLKKMLSF